MNSKFVPLMAVAAFAFSSICFSSCKKDVADSEIESSENNAFSESTFNDVTSIVDQSVLSGSVLMGVNGGFSASDNSGGLGSNCATVSLDTVNTTRTVIIDYGSTNCLCNDGRNRRGKIMATYTGRYRSVGTVINISFNNYFVNDNQVTGSKKITNNGPNAAGHLVYTVEVIGQVVKANNGGTVTWTSNRKREWLSGESTPLNYNDDVYSISGTANGVNANGVSYSVVITQPLVRAINCRWFESGKLDVSPQGKRTRALDYGSTGCDANATVTIAGKTYPITLR